MSPELINFERDDAAQDLLGYAGLVEPYEDVIERVSLEILRQSVADTEIESIRFVRSAGHHPGFKAGGTQKEEDSSIIIFQDLALPFDLELLVHTGSSRYRLNTTFTIECSKMDTEKRRDYRLDVHGQESA